MPYVYVYVYVYVVVVVAVVVVVDVNRNTLNPKGTPRSIAIAWAFLVFKKTKKNLRPTWDYDRYGWRPLVF